MKGMAFTFSKLLSDISGGEAFCFFNNFGAIAAVDIQHLGWASYN
jgi:hypothetical protein